MTWFRQIRSWFGVQYVILRHHDGAHSVKKASFMNGAWWAAPYLPHTRCKLLIGGDIKGQCYIHGWEPITKKVSDYYKDTNNTERKDDTCTQMLKF